MIKLKCCVCFRYVDTKFLRVKIVKIRSTMTHIRGLQLVGIPFYRVYGVRNGLPRLHYLHDSRAICGLTYHGQIDYTHNKD